MEDCFFGFQVFYYHQGGRIVYALIALVYGIPGVSIMLKCYLKVQPWSDLLTLYLSALVFLQLAGIIMLFHQQFIVGGEKCVASEAVLLHVLRELDGECSNDVINWRQIAHSANKFSEELGESPMVFYSGTHCMEYVIRHVVYYVNKGCIVFEDESREALQLHYYAENVVKKYKAKVQSFCSEVRTLEMPLSPFLRRLKATL